jgi:hypothetical protein
VSSLPRCPISGSVFGQTRIEMKFRLRLYKRVRLSGVKLHNLNDTLLAAICHFIILSQLNSLGSQHRPTDAIDNNGKDYLLYLKQPGPGCIQRIFSTTSLRLHSDHFPQMITENWAESPLVQILTFAYHPINLH